MKKGTGAKIEASRLTNRTSGSQVKKKEGGATTPQSSNQQYLKRTLRLLGVTDAKFEKQTKSSLQKELFPKTLPQPTNSKQFFFITYVCTLNLISKEEEQELSMWYPPRTVNEQIEYKKILFKMLQKLEAQGLVPKNLLISKMSLMGEGNPQSVVQFLRILSQLSLRQLYLEKYSKKQRLIQIGVNPNSSGSQNDINKFYVFPFSESITNVEPPLKSEVEAESLKKIFKVYIELYRKKILSLRTVEETEGINPQALMSRILEQKQLANTLQSKVNKSVYSENRAFDRRVILDKNQQIWKEIIAIPCNFISEEESSVLKVEGQTSKVLSNWRPVSGTPNLIEFNSEAEKVLSLKKKCRQKIEQLNTLKKEWISMLRKVEE